MILILCLVLVLGFWLVGCGPDTTAHTLSWDTNTELDMLEYRVYKQGQIWAIVAHSNDTTRQWVTIPDEPACYHVSAVDQEQLESELSGEACL